MSIIPTKSRKINAFEQKMCTCDSLNYDCPSLQNRKTSAESKYKINFQDFLQPWVFMSASLPNKGLSHTEYSFLFASVSP